MQASSQAWSLGPETCVVASGVCARAARVVLGPPLEALDPAARAIRLGIDPPERPDAAAGYPARLLLGGVPVGEVPDAHHLPALIEGVTIGLAVRSRRDAVPLHAASVLDPEGRLLILAGNKGSGKSTLSALLPAHGFTYLTDELSFVRFADAHLDPFPKRPTLKSGSFPLFAPSETWDDAVRGPVRYADVRPVGPAWVPRPASAILFPRHDPDAATPALTPLSPGDSLLRLIGMAFGGLERHRRTPGVLARLALLPAATLHFASLDGVLPRLAELLDTPASAVMPTPAMAPADVEGADTTPASALAP